MTEAANAGASIDVKACQTLSRDAFSILSLAADDAHIYAGTASGIVVWNCNVFCVKAKLEEGLEVLALELAKEKSWLFSSSSDKSVRIWSTKTLSPLFAIDTASSGDIFSLAWMPDLHTLYMGSQDATISWIRPPAQPSKVATHIAMAPRFHRFFDSQSAEQLAKTANLTRSSSASSLASSPPAHPNTVGILRPHSPGTPSMHSSTAQPNENEKAVEALAVESGNVKRYEHAGYIYALCIGKSNGNSVLVSGSGDEDVKVWTCTSEGIDLATTLSGESDAVMTLCCRDSTIFAGHQGGVIKIWDLETYQCIRAPDWQYGFVCRLVRTGTLNAHTSDILCLSVSPLDGDFFSGSATGEVTVRICNISEFGNLM